MEKDNIPPAFDIAKIEERFKNIKTLSDLTGKDGIIQGTTFYLPVFFPIPK
jgi:hypothetical protein